MNRQLFIKLQMVIKSVFLDMFRKGILKFVIEYSSSDFFHALTVLDCCSSSATAVIHKTSLLIDSLCLDSVLSGTVLLHTKILL